VFFSGLGIVYCGNSHAPSITQSLEGMFDGVGDLGDGWSWQ